MEGASLSAGGPARILAHPALAAALLAGLTFLAWGGALRNGFVWDDESLVVKNRWVHDLSRVPEYFSVRESASSDRLIARTYRPLQTLSLAVDEALWNGWPGGFHLTSLLLHAATALGLLLTFRVVVGAAPSLTAAAVFVVHPALSEAVLSVANRGGQLSALFGLASVGLFLRVRRPMDGPHALSAAAFGFALLSKEPAIALVALLPVVQLGLGRPFAPAVSRATVLLNAPYAVVAVVYLAVRHAVVGPMVVAPYWGGSLAATLALQAKVFAEYLRLVVWPFRLQARYTIAAPGPFPDMAVLAAALLSIALVGWALGSLRRRNPASLAALAILWFYLSLGPVSNLVPLPGSMLGERFLYLPLAGALPLLAGAAAALPLRRNATATLVAAVAAVAAFTAFIGTDRARTRVWADEGGFFELLERQEPSDVGVQARIAELEMTSGRAGDAVERIEALLPGLQPGPMLDTMRYWYVRALLGAGRVDDARRQVGLIGSGHPGGAADRALLVAEASAGGGDLEGARAALDEAARTDPKNDAVWNARGNVAWMAGDRATAATFYAQALRLNPANIEAATNLSRLDPGRRPVEAPEALPGR